MCRIALNPINDAVFAVYPTRMQPQIVLMHSFIWTLKWNWLHYSIFLDPALLVCVFLINFIIALVKNHPAMYCKIYAAASIISSLLLSVYEPNHSNCASSSSVALKFYALLHLAGHLDASQFHYKLNPSVLEFCRFNVQFVALLKQLIYFLI